MINIRRGEQEKVWFRTQRYFSVGSDWYVATREGVDVGPFKSRTEAASSIGRYLNGVRIRKDAGGYASRIAKDGVWATNNYV